MASPRGPPHKWQVSSNGLTQKGTLNNSTGSLGFLPQLPTPKFPAVGGTFATLSCALLADFSPPKRKNGQLIQAMIGSCCLGGSVALLTAGESTRGFRD